MFRTKTVVGVSLILVIVQSVSCIWQPSNLKNEIICDSVDCIRRGKFYKDNMDDRANPCQDFYTFTCGNWIKHHPGPKYTAEWLTQDIMVAEFAKIIRDVIESYKNDKNSLSLLQKAKELYNICVKIPEYPKSNASDIAREIKKVGRLPKTRLWDIHTKYLKLAGESALFGTKIIGKHPDGVPVLVLMEPTSAYGSILHGKTWKPQEKQAYTHFLFEIIKSLNLSDSDTQINNRIEKVFEFREKLNKIVLQHAKDDAESLKWSTAQELAKWFSDTLKVQTNTQDIPWVKVMGALYHKLPPRERHPRKLIGMRQRKYFIDLMDFLKNVPEDVLAFHMEIYFIERHLKFNDRMYKLLEGTSVEPHSYYRYIREKFYPRWETCIENHNMKMILEKMVYEKWFQSQKEEQKTVRQLIIDIKSKIFNLMSESEWVDLPTRVNTLGKLNDMKPWIGFPPWITGDEIPRLRHPKSILKPNAELNIEEKFIYVYAAILMSPVFNMKMPALYNYAGLGTTIGHELYHVINVCGSYIGTTGIVSWWSNVVQQKCFKKLALFVKAYNKITDREFKNRYDVVTKSNTNITVQENFPDVMGLEAAYSVYKDSVSTDNSICKTLPYFAEYSCDQMFYIAHANTYCAHYSKKAALLKLVESRHSIESVRLNGAVAQMESFGRAFNCPVGSPMNPETKVNLWK